MSTAPAPTEDDADAPAVAAVLRDAPFVRLVTRADGDAVAAAGLLARALRSAGVPFQIRTSPDPTAAATGTAPADDAATDGDLTVTVGAVEGDLELPGRPVSVTAFAVARELGVDPDPVLALAGVVAAGGTPAAHADVLDAAERRGTIERRPGVAVPTADLADGLAHSTLLSAPFSGTPEAAAATLADLGLPTELDAEARRRLASCVAVETATAAFATPRAAESVERALRPHATPDGPFETVGGYADVLDAVARERPGTGVALALGHDARTAALETWREHAATAHGALAASSTGRFDGLFVARVADDAPAGRPAEPGSGAAAGTGSASGTPVGRGPLATAARLLRDFRSPESVALVVSEGAGHAHAAAASVDPRDVGAALSEVGSVFNGDGSGTVRHGTARFDADTDEFVAALREALA
jgi:hypothetical protein